MTDGKGKRGGGRPAKSKESRGSRSGSGRSGRRGAPRGGAGAAKSPGRLWLYGAHPVLAALTNSARRCRRLLITVEAERRLGSALSNALATRRDSLSVERQDRRDLAAPLPEGAVHQGLALEAEPLEQPALFEIAESAGPGSQVVVALDQVTDPQNVGAILRSAAAFGALAVLAPERHAAPESGALAKAASGALERLPYVPVTNLARALDELKAAGFWCLGLDSEAERSLPQASPLERAVLVLGAEGPGLRRLTRERCDLLVRLPTRPAMGHLNVSNAAAVALYELLGGAVEG